MPAAAPLLGVLVLVLAGESLAEAAGEPRLEEIVVTAQKRAVNLQRTPAAVTAIGGEALVAAGVSDIRAAQNLVPSARFQMQNSSTEIYIRGVGSTLDLPNIEPPTVFNFSGIYIPREGTSAGLFDIASIEVLPGPQGTLYGRAALGGTVNVGFNRPARDTATAVLLEAGDYSLGRASVAQNLPVGRRGALRAAADYIRHDGYQATGADSKDDYGLRLSGLHEGERFGAYAWVQGTRKHGRSPNLVRRGYNGGRFDGDPDAFEGRDPWDDRITATEPDAGRQQYENLVAGAEFEWRLGAATLTWLPSYFTLDWAGNYWLENLPSFLSARYDQVTQELRLAGPGDGRLSWLAGLYAYRVTNDGEFVVAGFPLADVDHNRLEGLAAFGEATVAVGGRWRLTAGGRLSRDERQGRGATAFGEPYAVRQDFDELDWKLGAEFDAAPEVMLYATVQTGYQPGTYNLFPPTPQRSNEVREAGLTAWSVGAKSRFLDGRLQLNTELFFYDYRDLLVQSFNLNTALLTTFNADRVETWGKQLDLLWQAGEHGRLKLSVGWLRARYERFVVPDDIDIGPGRRDFAGEPLQNAPDWTVSAGYQRDFPLAAGYLRARVESRYESAFWATFTQSRGTRQPDYTKSDASLTYHAGDGRWSAGLWVKNIENEAVLAATTTGQFGPYADAFLEPPRTWGLRFTLGL